jgi:hypothetical protein
MTTNFIIYQISVKTLFKKNKQVILSSLFLAYYVVYAISPLSYTCSVKRIVDRLDGTSGMPASSNNLHIFLMDAICAKMDSINENDTTNSTVTLLLTKKRAVLPENTCLKFAPSVNVCLFEHIASFSDSSPSRLLVSSGIGSSIGEFDPLHSGPAPPAA